MQEFDFTLICIAGFRYYHIVVMFVQELELYTWNFGQVAKYGFNDLYIELANILRSTFNHFKLITD